MFTNMYINQSIHEYYIINFTFVSMANISAVPFLKKNLLLFLNFRLFRFYKSAMTMSDTKEFSHTVSNYTFQPLFFSFLHHPIRRFTHSILSAIQPFFRGMETKIERLSAKTVIRLWTTSSTQRKPGLPVLTEVLLSLERRGFSNRK